MRSSCVGCIGCTVSKASGAPADIGANFCLRGDTASRRPGAHIWTSHALATRYGVVVSEDQERQWQ